MSSAVAVVEPTPEQVLVAKLDAAKAELRTCPNYKALALAHRILTLEVVLKQVRGEINWRTQR